MANLSRTKCLLNKNFIFVLLMATTKWYTCNSSSLNVGCKYSERKALLNFKHSLSFLNLTWEGEDCCKWSRVSCDPTTGYVYKLQFRGYSYHCSEDEESHNFIETENLEPSLQHLKELQHLEYLDLSCNDFSESKMPKALGSMQQLRYLNLSSTHFSKGIPDELSNLTHLKSLDLSHPEGSLTFNHLYWVSSLQKLEYLDLTFSDLSQADDWVKSLFGPLPSLRDLRLAYCELPAYNKAILNSSLVAHPIQYLDLSYNQLGGEIPNFIQNLTCLEYLDLSSGEFGPNIPLWLGKVQSLVHLDLSKNYFTSIDATSIWGLVHNLCGLRLLSLSHNKLHGNLLEPLDNSSTICTRYDLEVLDLSLNHNINGAIPAWLGEKLRSLKRLDLGYNLLSGEIPTSVGMMPLEYLAFSGNNLIGTIPASFGNLFVLKELYLSDNKLNQISPFLKFPPALVKIDISRNNLTGQIPPKSLGNLSKLESLDLSRNNLIGQIPKSLGSLSNLESLDMSSNPLLNGTVVSKTHFTNLTNLMNLYLSDTFLTLKLPVDWVPPFQLGRLDVGSCKLNENFPQWLQTQKYLETLNLSNAGISGAIPKWFHTMQHLLEVDLSYNQISGSPVFPINFQHIYFSNNALSSPLFSIDDSVHINVTYPHAFLIDLSNNLISGQLPEDIVHRMPNLDTLVLSNNQIYGPIPRSMCQVEWELLDLQKNRLSGTIPNCLGSAGAIDFISLSFNNFSGNIPCFGPSVRYMHLNDNKLSGQLPLCFENNTQLRVLDVGGNELSGKMPAWLTKENVPDLEILRLRGNKFDDSIPQHLCSLSTLQILDLSHNHLSGTIPYCLSNFTAMNSPPNNNLLEDEEGEEVKNGVKEVIQGIERAYTTTLKYLVNIDLSCNELAGNIPDGITNLSYLLSLNLSNNHLSGLIPQKIGDMKSLIALDISKNRLVGTIPTSMAELYELSYLNLSYNNFSGQFPTGYQLQTLVDPSIYAGNPFLCGDFLPKKCKTINVAPKGSENNGVEEDEDEDNKHETMWFYLVVMSGFATGFWGVVGSLFLKRSWRQSLFRRVEDAYDWLYMVIVVRMARLKTKWDGSSD